MEAIQDVVTTLRRMNIRTLLGQTIQLGEVVGGASEHLQLQDLILCATPQTPCCCTGLIITSALMIWKTLMLVTRSESPVGHLNVARRLFVTLCLC